MIHVYHEEGRVTVWLDTEVGEKDGICLASELTEDEALMAALMENAQAYKEIAEHRNKLFEARKSALSKSANN